MSVRSSRTFWGSSPISLALSLGRMTFVDTSPEKFYGSLLEWEAATEEGVALIEPPEIEEPEEVPPEDYKVCRLD